MILSLNYEGFSLSFMKKFIKLVSGKFMKETRTTIYYTDELNDEFSLTPKQQINYTLEEFKNSWIAKENTPCIFISAREKIGIDKLRGDLYKMVAEIHAGRYPFDNFFPCHNIIFVRLESQYERVDVYDDVHQNKLQKGICFLR